MSDTIASRPTERASAKWPYRQPSLTRFGSVSELTCGQNGSLFDNGQNNSIKLGQG